MVLPLFIKVLLKPGSNKCKFWMLHRATVVVGAISHASDALAWNYMQSGNMLMRTRRRRKSF